MQKKSKALAAGVLAPFLLLTLSLLGGCKSSPAAAVQAEAEPQSTVQNTRKPREGIQTMLVMGLEAYDSGESGSFRSGTRSDLLLLIVMDEGKKEAKMLQINPDTMIPCAPPGADSETEMPLGLVISYGSGGSDSCLSQRKAVSRLLGGVPVDHYMTVTPDAIAVISDMLDGIPVAPTDAFQAWNPQSDGEREMVLRGDTAKDFFFTREEDDVENLDHMERQRRFLTKLFSPFMEKAQDEDFLMKLTMQLGEGFATDLTLSQMVQLLQELGNYELEEEISVLPGSASLVDGIPQFRVEEQGLGQLLDVLFF